MFTDKERTILKALLEEELQTILGQSRNRDALLNSYLFSLAGIMNKVDVDEAQSSATGRFYTLNQELSTEGAA